MELLFLYWGALLTGFMHFVLLIMSFWKIYLAIIVIMTIWLSVSHYVETVGVTEEDKERIRKNK